MGGLELSGQMPDERKGKRREEVGDSFLFLQKLMFCGDINVPFCGSFHLLMIRV